MIKSGTNPTTPLPTTAKAQPSATASYMMMAANRDTVTIGQLFELLPNTTTSPDSTVLPKSDPKVVSDINPIDQYFGASMNTTASLLINSTVLPNTVLNTVSTTMHSILNVPTTTRSTSTTMNSTERKTSTNPPPDGENDIVEPPVITPVLDTCSTYREYKARVSNNIDEEHHHPNHCCENMRVTLADYPRISGNFIKRRG